MRGRDAHRGGERLAWLDRLKMLPTVIRWQLKGRQVFSLGYPCRLAPRWGHGLPVHPELHELLARRRDAYAATLESILVFRPQLRAIPRDQPASPQGPCWAGPNTFLPPLDAAVLYGLLASRRPRLYVEVGSGYSTRFARRAVSDHGLATRVVSIDPHPRADVDAICDEVVRRRLEDTDLQLFRRLEPGDVLYMDGSHRCLPNSDATVFFLEVLPRLASGVIVQVHDVHLPSDYPPKGARKYWSEQYLVAASLLAAGSAEHVLLPNAFIAGDGALAAILEPLWQEIGLPPRRTGGVAFWMIKR